MTELWTQKLSQNLALFTRFVCTCGGSSRLCERPRSIFRKHNFCQLSVLFQSTKRQKFISLKLVTFGNAREMPARNAGRKNYRFYGIRFWGGMRFLSFIIRRTAEVRTQDPLSNLNSLRVFKIWKTVLFQKQLFQTFVAYIQAMKEHQVACLEHSVEFRMQIWNLWLVLLQIHRRWSHSNDIVSEFQMNCSAHFHQTVY